MWDTSWDCLTFSEFADKPFIKGDKENHWSLQYCMDYQEMEKWNKLALEKAGEIKPIRMPYHQFNGCGLVMSSEVIRGTDKTPPLNVPKDHTFFISEDTGFLYQTRRHQHIIPQYLFRDVLLVHNRKHPNKRSDIVGEEHIEDRTSVGRMRQCHDWYNTANQYCQENLSNLFNPDYKPKGWKDVFEKA